MNSRSAWAAGLSCAWLKELLPQLPLNPYAETNIFHAVSVANGYTFLVGILACRCRHKPELLVHTSRGCPSLKKTATKGRFLEGLHLSHCFYYGWSDKLVPRQIGSSPLPSAGVRPISASFSAALPGEFRRSIVGASRPSDGWKFYRRGRAHQPLEQGCRAIGFAGRRCRSEGRKGRVRCDLSSHANRFGIALCRTSTFARMAGHSIRWHHLRCWR
jgi:hypothetical protein